MNGDGGALRKGETMGGFMARREASGRAREKVGWGDRERIVAIRKKKRGRAHFRLAWLGQLARIEILTSIRVAHSFCIRPFTITGHPPFAAMRPFPACPSMQASRVPFPCGVRTRHTSCNTSLFRAASLRAPMRARLPLCARGAGRAAAGGMDGG